MKDAESLFEQGLKAVMGARYGDPAFAEVEQGMRQSLIAFLKVIREPSNEMRRAWVAAHTREGWDPDAPEVLHGTGQGDLTMCLAWMNVWRTFYCEERHQAMIDNLISEAEQKKGPTAS